MLFQQSQVLNPTNKTYIKFVWVSKVFVNQCALLSICFTDTCFMSTTYKKCHIIYGRLTLAGPKKLTANLCQSEQI